MTRARGFRTQSSTYAIGAAPTGRARCRRCGGRIDKGAVRIEIRAFVRAACLDARFAAAVLAVHGSAERVPVQAGLVGSTEARRVRDALAAASGGGGGRCVA